MIPVIGTIIGGIIGGIVGGAGGGFIGPHPATPFAGVGVNVNGSGLLEAGASVSQLTDITPYQQAASAGINSTNAFLMSSGVKISSAAGALANPNTPGNQNPGGIQWIGQGSAGDPNFYSDLFTPNSTGSTEFSKLRFSSGDKYVNNMLSGSSFADLNGLQSAVTQVQTFVNTTVPALLALGKSPTADGTFTTNIVNLNTSFTNAIANAKLVGMATDDLSAAWKSATKQLTDALQTQMAATDNGFTSRFLTAKASVSGNPYDAMFAQAWTFDVSAASQRTQLDQMLTTLYGDGIRSTETYATQMASLEKTLGEERLAIVQAYNDKLTAAATQGVTSLSAYTMKLQSGANSPLSPSAQYAMAGNQFNADAMAAKAGNWNSITNLPTYADTLLNASKAYNGTGTAYAADYSRVLDVLSSLAGASPDTLTASVYTSETRTQTQQLSSGLVDLKNSVDSLKLALTQGAAAPARVA